LLNVLDEGVVNGHLVVGHFSSVSEGWPVQRSPLDQLVLYGRELTVIPTLNLRYFVVA
jgi:hypothetical protein